MSEVVLLIILYTARVMASEKTWVPLSEFQSPSRLLDSSPGVLQDVCIILLLFRKPEVWVLAGGSLSQALCIQIIKLEKEGREGGRKRGKKKENKITNILTIRIYAQIL